MNYIELFKKSAGLYKDDIAIADLDGTRNTTYGQLDVLSGKVAAKLHTAGIKKGSFIVINMQRRMEYLAAYIGILKVGCAVVPVVPDYPKERIDYIIGNCSAAAVITDEFFGDIDGYEIFEDAAEGKSPALLVYTSGSTGKPKGILVSVDDVVRSIYRNKNLYEGIDKIVHGASSPFSFMAHIFETLVILDLGGVCHILPDYVRKSADALARYFVKHGITVAWMVPQLLRMFSKIELKNGKLKCIISGGERMSNICDTGYEVRNCYGLSESVGIATMFRNDRKYENTPIGKPLNTLMAVICDENGTPLPDGCEGEICLIGDFDVVYFGDPERTEKTMVRRDDGKTVLHSGDIGVKDENGNLIYVNRKDWMVKINGQRVETAEIEALLCEIVTDADINELPKIKDVVLKLPLARQQQLELYLAAEECFVNICTYAFEGKSKENEKIHITFAVSDRIEMQFEDGGMPFDPIKNLNVPDDYDIDTQMGGLGNFIAFSSVDDVEYEYRNNKNVLTFTKYLS